MAELSLANKPFNSLQQTAHQLASCTDQLFQQLEQQQALASITDRIRSSLDLERIFKTTAAEIRQLLNADRVGVFRFTPESNWNEGEFVAEDAVAGIPSVIAKPVREHCFSEKFAAYYAQGRGQAIADIHTADLSDCYIKTLKQFQIRANLIVPILQGDELWGLLCVHQCHNPRRWQLSEIEFVRKIATHFAIALQQAEYLEQLRERATLQAQAEAQTAALARQQALVKITNRIRKSLDWQVVCQTATDEVRQLLDADRVAIYQFNEDWSGDFRVESIAEGWEPLVGVSPAIEDTHLMDTQGGRYADNETFAIPDIYEAGHTDCHVALLEQFQARAYAIAPIFQGDRLWGLLAAFQNSGPRPWPADEVELLAQIGEQLGIALQQAKSVQKIQAQSAELKQLLTERQQSQAQLMQNEKMASLGQLVAGVAHEINNPVNFIYGNLSHVNRYVGDVLSLINGYQTQDLNSGDNRIALQAQAEKIDLDFVIEDLPKTLDSMRIGADRIRHIVLSLRNFSRLDEAERKAVNIHEGLDSTLLILSHRLKACSEHPEIQVVKTYGTLPPVECYPAQLNQVFMNLLANALDAVDEKIASQPSDHQQPETDYAPTIWLTTQLNKAGQVEIRIRDNGAGIKKKHKNKVFEHFFTTKVTGKGTGLGLAISKQIVIEKHGGTLGLKSTSGRGAEFIIGLSTTLGQ
ncbi:MAG: GAF domain-containing protein [Leptolyngbyaceae cyanobacterium]